MLFNSKNNDMTNLPAWMIDGELLAGKVESSSVYRQSLPGVPKMCIAVPTGFLRVLHMLKEQPDECVYGYNTNAAMAEITLKNKRYAACLTLEPAKFSTMVDGKALGNRNDLPDEMEYLLYFPFMMEDEEFNREFELLMNSSDDGEKKFHTATLADNFYFRYKEMKVTAALEKNMTRLTEVKAKDSRYISSKQSGTFKYFPNSNSGSASNPVGTFQVAMTAQEFQGHFAVVQDVDLTAEEKAAVPVLNDRMVITPQHVEVAKTVQQSLLSGGPFAFTNYLFRGAPGGGKSTFIRILAAGLNLPFYSDVIRTDSDSDIFSGYFAPATDDDKDSALALENLPSVEDMAFDPVTSYQKMTGQVKTDATPADCQREWQKILLASQNKEKGARLKFVEGLIPRLKRPCLVFYDEVTVAQNPALMAALNTIMDDQRVFTLTSGEVIHRHPLSVMAFAGNFGEVEGCRAPNRAWQDRCHEIIDVLPPSSAQLKEQLIAMTGWNPQTNGNIPIDTFVSILPELVEISEDYYGVCSVRGVAAWLAKSMICGNVFVAAETTVITHACDDPAGQEELRKKIQDKFAI